MRLVNTGSPEVEMGIKRLNGAKVKFPDAPTDIELYFGLHGIAEHLDPGFGDALQGADIFALEQVGWARSTLELTQRLAEGDEDARTILDRNVHGIQKEFWREMHRSIFDSHVIIHNPDVPQGHALAVQHERATNEAWVVAEELLAGLPTESIPPNLLQGLAQRLFSIYNKREKYILEHFFPKELPSKDGLRVVGFFGILHRGIATVLARQASKADRDDVRVSINETSIEPPKAYEDFLQQRKPDADSFAAFLTHRMS